MALTLREKKFSSLIFLDLLEQCLETILSNFQLYSYLIDAIVTYYAEFVILSQIWAILQFCIMLKNRYLLKMSILLRIFSDIEI